MDAPQNKYAKLIGKVIDNRYEILQVKGIGGMAIVLKAKDLMKNRTVAIKMLNEKYSNDTAAIRRFVNESKAIALLSNEHIVDIYDVAFTGQNKYIVMEYIDGITLKEYMKRNAPIGIDKAIVFTMQILSALQHAHEKGVVHRDIKPQNIMVQANGKLKVTDFGIAQITDHAGSASNGVAMGTVYYISPEQASGSATTYSSDIYSVGVMLYEMVTNTLPFEGDTPLAIAMMQVNNTPVPPRKVSPSIPLGLEQIILKAMNKAPEDRFRSAASMLRACEIIKKDKTIVFEDVQTSAMKKPSPSSTADRTAKQPKKEESARRSPKTIFPIILGVTTAFLLVAAISGAILIMSLLHMSEDQTKVVPIPELVGTEYTEELVTQLGAQNIRLAVTQVNNETFPAGQIVSQDPVGGQTRKIANASKFVTINVDVSMGKSSFVLADYTNQDYRTVRIALEKLGAIVSVQEKHDPLIISGFVIASDPAPGTTINYGDTVTIQVSKGVETVYSNMIDVRGQSESDAKRNLLNANFVVGTLTHVYSDTVEEGKVIDQSIAPGSSTAQKQTPVNLTISLGPKPADPGTQGNP